MLLKELNYYLWRKNLKEYKNEAVRDYVGEAIARR